MRCLIIVLFLFSIRISVAQLSQPARYEIQVESLNESFFTASAQESGLFIFKIKQEKSSIEEKIWQFIWLDTTLNEVKKWELPINASYSYRAATYSDNQIFFYFRKG